jgi:hypothetical protein
MFEYVKYSSLNSKQRENYNFQKLSAVLADYGFYCIRLSADWQGADLIACHVDGSTFIKIQLKGRLTLDQIYRGKSIHIAFRDKDDWYVYPHDELRDKLLRETNLLKGTKSWEVHQGYSWPRIPKHLMNLLSEYKL